MYKSSTLKELEKLANDRVLNSEARGTLFKKLAVSGMDAKSVNKMLSDAQKAFAKARSEYSDANSQLAGLQQRVDTAQSEMSGARKTMMDINLAAQTMHLTGAEGLKQEKGGEYSYIVDGDRMHADTTNFEDIGLIPWKEYISSKKSDESNDELEDSDGFEDENEDEEVEVDGEDLVDELNEMLTSGNIPDKSDDEEEGEESSDLSERARPDTLIKDEPVKSDQERYPAVQNPLPEFDPDFTPSFEAASGAVEKSIITKVAKKKFR